MTKGKNCDMLQKEEKIGRKPGKERSNHDN